MRLNKLSLLVLNIFLIVSLHAGNKVLWESIEYIIYNDSRGVWLAYPEKFPELVYALPNGHKINDIVLIPEMDEALFVENHVKYTKEIERGKEVSYAWAYRNFRLIPNVSGDKFMSTAKPAVKTVAGHVTKSSLDYRGQLYNKLLTSPSGNYLVAQRRNTDNIGFDVFERTEDKEWLLRHAVDNLDWAMPLGWGAKEKRFYFLSLQGDMVSGTSRLNMLTGETFFLEEDLPAGAVSEKHNLLMTFPTSYGFGRPQQIEFYTLSLPRNLVSRLQVKINGGLIREKIIWNQNVPSVLCPFEVQVRSAFDYELVIISPVDSLNRRISLPHMVTDISWIPDEEAVLYSAQGRLYYLNTIEGESEEVVFADSLSRVLNFAVKWHNDGP